LTGSYYDAYAVAPRGPTSSVGDRCSVAFWNLTGHELTIKVDGQGHAISAGKSIPLEVGRQFVWKIEGREPQTERIATGESALEIVIRR
jgi:hypothetical protein